jgi:hypothetical protein
MLTMDDVLTVPLFSSLAAAELDRLAQTSADMHLAAVGEGSMAIAFVHQYLLHAASGAA